MRIHERFGRLERKLQKETDTVTQADEEYASKLYAKYLNYLQAIASYIPHDPLTEEEMEHLADVFGRMALQGKVVSLPSKSDKSTNL